MSCPFVFVSACSRRKKRKGVFHHRPSRSNFSVILSFGLFFVSVIQPTFPSYVNMPNIDILKKLYTDDPKAIFNVIDQIYDRIDREGLNGIWILIVPREKVRHRAEQLMSLSTEDRQKLSLFGIPFAVKDNIDVAGLKTTAACPSFACEPVRESAPVVSKLEEAGAILIGKTNMDQFATGLVGTRSPYGICSSVFNPKYISGGSSSGSAVAVASGLVNSSLPCM